MISLDKVSKSYGKSSVLDKLSLEIDEGARVALVGRNGAGKTTLLRAILGLTDFTGSIEVAGYDVRDHGCDARAHVGYVPQRPPVAPVRLREFVELFAALRGTPRTGVADVLASLGLDLTHAQDKTLAELSGGTLQKVLLALALAARVPVLLLDEPTANLDPVAREDFLQGLGRVDESTTILIASHRLEEIEAATDRVVVLDGGAIAFDGTLRELRLTTGTRGRLWIELPRSEHSRAVEILSVAFPDRDVSVNGRGVRIEAASPERGSIVSRLAEAGLSPGDLRTADEPLDRVLGRLHGDVGARRPDDASHVRTLPEADE